MGKRTWPWSCDPRNPPAGVHGLHERLGALPRAGHRRHGARAPEPDATRIGTNHFAWEVDSFDELQAMVRHLKEKDVEKLRSRYNSFSTGIYLNDPDGNGLEIYYEDWSPSVEVPGRSIRPNPGRAAELTGF